jgi:hypothetical protein
MLYCVSMEMLDCPLNRAIIFETWSNTSNHEPRHRWRHNPAQSCPSLPPSRGHALVGMTWCYSHKPCIVQYSFWKTNALGASHYMHSWVMGSTTIQHIPLPQLSVRTMARQPPSMKVPPSNCHPIELIGASTLVLMTSLSLSTFGSSSSPSSHTWHYRDNYWEMVIEPLIWLNFSKYMPSSSSPPPVMISWW